MASAPCVRFTDLLDWPCGCAHRRTSFPVTLPVSIGGDGVRSMHAETYVMCLDLRPACSIRLDGDAHPHGRYSSSVLRPMPTKDFRHVERVSLIPEADYRNVVIFPEKFDGLYAGLDRPHSEISPWSIWISYSPDLRFWASLD